MLLGEAHWGTQPTVPRNLATAKTAGLVEFYPQDGHVCWEGELIRRTCFEAESKASGTPLSELARHPTITQELPGWTESDAFATLNR